jgi:cytochrome P450
MSEFDLRQLPASYYDDPYRVFAEIRATTPIYRLPDGSVLLTRHADLVTVYRDVATFSSDKKAEFAPKFGADSALYEHHTTSLVFNDPPAHTRVRKLMMGALTRRAIDDMQPSLIKLVDGLLDEIEQTPADQLDLIEHFAAAIPIDVIGNLLNIPSSERKPLRAWSLGILGALEPTLSPEREAKGNRCAAEFKAYLHDLVVDRKAHPGDPEHDVLTRLIRGEANAAPLTDLELLHNCIFILNAGHETTTNLIGNTLVGLSQHPDTRANCLRMLAEAQAKPEQAEALLNDAVDEFLRFEAPVQLGNRRALTVCSVGGEPFPTGTRFTLCIAAANRDPAVFPEPDRFNIRRQNNKHLAFAYGIHQCAGLSLARLEGRIAISHFLHRFPNYQLRGTAVRDLRARFRGFLSVPFAV